MGLTSARLMLKTLIATSLTTAAARKVYVRGYSPAAEKLREAIVEQASYISIVPISTKDISRIALRRVQGIPSTPSPLVATLTNGVLVLSGNAPGPSTILILTTLSSFYSIAFAGGETIPTIAHLIVTELTSHGIFAVYDGDVTIHTSHTVQAARITVSNSGNALYEVGRDLTTFKVTIYSWSQTQRDIIRDLIVPRVGSTYCNRVVLDDGSSAILLRESEVPSVAAQVTEGAASMDILFTMDYAVTLSNLATPVAVTDTTLVVNGSQPVSYIL